MIKSLIFLPLKRDGNLSVNKLRGPRIFIFFFSYFFSLVKQ